jgi:hypothetical protein
MTPDDFRRLALSLPGAIEAAHMGHPDFRVNDKIFATLQYPNDSWGTLMLTPEQQREYVLSSPEVFTPVKGGWGLKGATSVRLQTATEAILHPAITAAWNNKSQKSRAKPISKRKKTTR